MCKIVELCSELTDVINQIAEESNTLANDLKVEDQKVNDLCHYVEFNDLDVVRGFKAYKQLQECLKTRRTIKNGLSLANAINKTDLYGININISTAVDLVKSQKYTPRQFPELFTEEQTQKTASEVKPLHGTYVAVGTKDSSLEITFISQDEAVKFVAQVIAVKKVDKDLILLNIHNAITKGTAYAGWKWKLVTE